MGYGLWCCVVLHRKISPTQLWVELSWVVAINGHMNHRSFNFICTPASWSLRSPAPPKSGDRQTKFWFGKEKLETEFMGALEVVPKFAS